MIDYEELPEGGYHVGQIKPVRLLHLTKNIARRLVVDTTQTNEKGHQHRIKDKG